MIVFDFAKCDDVVYLCRQHPGVKWAQRKESVFMTVELQDCEDVSMDLTEEGVLTFK